MSNAYGKLNDFNEAPIDLQKQCQQNYKELCDFLGRKIGVGIKIFENGANSLVVEVTTEEFEKITEAGLWNLHAFNPAIYGNIIIWGYATVSA